MERACFLLRVRPEKLDEYKARHREVWPEMLDALRTAGWHNYSLFLRPDEGMVVGYLETDDFARATAEMSRTAINDPRSCAGTYNADITTYTTSAEMMSRRRPTISSSFPADRRATTAPMMKALEARPARLALAWNRSTA